MKMVARLSNGQAKQLEKKLFRTDSYFNPIEDADGNWVVSLEEVALCDRSEFAWVKTLPLIPYKPKPQPPMTGLPNG
jgi:hypothetical protein